MTCTESVCGTGEFNGPKPGDPSDPSTLAATTVYGGITVSWSYPATNPHAVAHTLLFRGVTANFEAAIQIAVVSGSLYFDRISVTQDTGYYYWIKQVSVNATVGALIGPAFAVALPIGQQTLESLTGLIDEGVLAQALKTRIDGIDLYGQSLTDEIADRLLDNEALAAAIAAVQSGLAQAMTFVSQEITQRTEGDSALLQVLNLYAAAVEDNVSAIRQEEFLRVTKDDALARDITQLYVTTGDLSASISDESLTRATQNSALAQQIVSAQAQFMGNLATVQTGLQTKITATDGKVASIGALYTAKVQVNGLIGGFGVFNDGSVVEAGFDVDRFWVGRTNTNKRKPFIIDNDVTYIDSTVIREASIGTLLLSGNAVTIPVAVNSVGSLPSATITLNVAGVIYAHGTANYISGGSGSQSIFGSISIGGVQGGNVGVSLSNDYSGSISTGFARNLPAGTYTISLVTSASGSGLNLGACSLFILGVQR